MASAARTLTDAGVPGSTNVFSRVVAAAEALHELEVIDTATTASTAAGYLHGAGPTGITVIPVPAQIRPLGRRFTRNAVTCPESDRYCTATRFPSSETDQVPWSLNERPSWFFRMLVRELPPWLK
jgi:hypothetical protein